jgi:hypothetical protein
LTRSGCSDTTSVFPSLNWRAAGGCIPFSTQSTTRSSAQATLFGGYNVARVWHFWLMWIYILFVVPHVILVFTDGWDTLRSMIVGWSTRVERSEVVANEQ